MNTRRIVRLAIPILIALALWSGFMLALHRPRVPFVGLSFGMSQAEVLRARPDDRVPVQGEMFQANALSFFHQVPSGYNDCDPQRIYTRATFGDKLQQINQFNLHRGIFKFPLVSCLGWRQNRFGLWGRCWVDETRLFQNRMVGVVVAVDKKKQTGGFLKPFPKILRN